MIPVELKLKNFISYGSSSEPVKFDGFNVACLTGDNGNGKSALLDAITWAVWGRARGTDERGAGADDLIHSGAEDMEVEFSFQLEGDTYRVCRRRDSRRRKSSLEFQIYDGEGYRSISADNINETQQKIIQVLRMDYHTFTSSSFVLQGKADTFTAMKPSERKKILGEILGLSVYRDMEALAREEVNTANATINKIVAKLEEITPELNKNEEYQQEKQQLEAKKQQLYQQYDQEQREVDQLRKQVSELQQVKNRVHELEQQLKDQNKQIDTVEKRVQTLQQQVKQGEELVKRADEIEANYQQLQQLMEQDGKYNEKSRQLLKLNEDKSKQEKKLQQEQAAVEKRQTQLQSELKHYQTLTQEKKQLAEKLVQVEKKISEYKQLEKQQQELKDNIQTYDQNIKAKEMLAKNLKQRVEELREKYSALRKPVPECPLCRTELSNDDRERVLNEMTADGQQLNDQHQKLQQEIKELNVKSKQASTQLVEIEQKVANYSVVEQEQSVLRHRLNEARQAAEKQTEVEKELTDVQNTLKEKNYALELQKEINDIEQQIYNLNYNTGEHTNIQKEIKKLKPYQQQYHNLQSAQGALENHRENMQHFKENLQSLQHAANASSELIEQHNAKLKDLQVTEKKLKTAEKLLENTSQEINQTERNLGTVQEKIDRCERLEQEKKNLTTEKNITQQEKKYYNELIKAFGRNGIQAIIIENAIPELEQEANHILQQISEGRLTVALLTQKESKSSKKVVETLDIYISDESSTRRYEMFSGGEAFKVNFSLRIALSRLLARRAGARLQTLVIDEGFGTQDAQGKEKLVQAINAIAADFEKIIVITHIEELKNSFPVQLVVTKTSTGSILEVRHN
ncbi:MAG: SMC family ATPase [Firmicutes bacterium]|nr:SMC family ATPase [Bacillota bacterium]